MEESDVEEDLRRLTNLKSVKIKKHRFGLPVWHICGLYICRFYDKTLHSRWTFTWATVCLFAWELTWEKVCKQYVDIGQPTCSVALWKRWPNMQECLLIMCGKMLITKMTWMWSLSRDHRGSTCQFWLLEWHSSSIQKIDTWINEIWISTFYYWNWLLQHIHGAVLQLQTGTWCS